jgi:hypothetical protein
MSGRTGTCLFSNHFENVPNNRTVPFACMPGDRRQACPCVSLLASQPSRATQSSKRDEATERDRNRGVVERGWRERNFLIDSSV